MRAGRLPGKILLLAIAVAFGGAYYRAGFAPVSAGFVAPAAAPSEAVAAKSSVPFYRSQLIPNTTAASVHSATAAEISGGRLRAIWYGGSREGAPDVALYTSVYSSDSGTWSPEHAVFTRESTQDGLRRYVRKLGNPVLARGSGGRLHLFFVSVTLGGWAGSAINGALSADEGETWGAPRRLVTSPFFNISTLVKGAPFLFADGSLGLPAYHEFIGKFGELLRLDAEGRVLDKERLSWGKSSLQPVIVPKSAKEAVAFMRYAGQPPNRILSLRTIDGGRHWDSPVKTLLPNPNSAIGSVRLSDGLLLLAFNDSEADRRNLSLAVSWDFGGSWRTVYSFEGHPGEPSAPIEEYSYPWILQDHSGNVHVLYTWGRTRIKHVEFNRAWLETLL
jgi:predicted neuraminidase